jgi:hypothetical protein
MMNSSSGKSFSATTKQWRCGFDPVANIRTFFRSAENGRNFAGSVGPAASVSAKRVACFAQFFPLLFFVPVRSPAGFAGINSVAAAIAPDAPAHS